MRFQWMRRSLGLGSCALAALLACLVLQAHAGNGKGKPDKSKIVKGSEYNPVIVPEDFMDEHGNPLPIDNPFMPLVGGTTYSYVSDDGEELNDVFVTHDIKLILGVPCTVVLDTVVENGVLTESTFDWYAQDHTGRVWYFGEATESYSGGTVSTTGSWEAGVDGAKPGIIMLADPQTGDAYRQEYYPGVAEDLAKVVNLGSKVEVPFGSFDPCLKTKEWSPLSQGDVEHKYYAPGWGLVLVEELKGGTRRVELVDVD
jgi:hypothetical protein